jgi:nucleoside-diphosphate-sugar epimerase
MLSLFLNHIDLETVKNNKISILGCGWLGLPLAKSLVDNGYEIKGSTTTQDKCQKLVEDGVTPYLIKLNERFVEGEIKDFLKESELLIINIPPGLRNNPKKNHVSEIKQLIHHVENSTIKYILYISSTSVFKDVVEFPLITQITLPNATSNSAKQLIDIENLLKTSTKFESTILRFSGLIGKDRHPGKILSGRKNILNGKAPINLIHRDDCISIISKLIKKQLWGATFNASNPYRHTREDYYTNYCKEHHLVLPEFDQENVSKGKIIDSTKLAQLIKHKYKTSL